MKLELLEPNNGEFPISHRYAKYRVILSDGDKRHTVYFGDNRYIDHTTDPTHDADRKKRYLARHIMRENFADPTTAGFWSANLLWNKTNVSDSLADIKKRFPDLK